MRKVATLVLASLLVTGCSKSGPPPMLPTESAPVDLSGSATAGPASAASPATVQHWTAGRPVQDGWPAILSRQPLATEADLCPVSGTEQRPLLLKIVAATWERHPGAKEDFWVPTVTIAACNSGASQGSNNLVVGISGSPAFESELQLRVGRIAPGAGIKPTRVPLAAGLPDALFKLMQAGQLDWPALTVRLTTFGAALTARLEPPVGTSGQAIPDWHLPPEPSPALLAAASWKGAQPLGTDRTLYLYAPAVSYRFAERAGCAIANAVGASAAEWLLYRLGPDGRPTRLGSLGTFTFAPSLGWQVADRPQLGQAFLLLESPPGCHASGYHELWALDRQTERLRLPEMITPKWRGPAYLDHEEQLEPDGTLILDSYDGGDVMAGPQFRYTFRWDPADGNWHAGQPSPVDGPAGAPTSPAKVY
jgi:hypothetical protein